MASSSSIEWCTDSYPINDILDYIAGNTPVDLEPYLSKGLSYVDRICVVEPYSSLSWLLVLKLKTSMFWRHNECEYLVVYNNEVDWRWIIAGVVGEAVTRVCYRTGYIAYGLLRYLAVYKLGLRDLYRGVIEYFNESMDSTCIKCDRLDLLLKAIPLTIASDLMSEDYGRIVYIAMHGDNEVIEYWLSKKPSREHKTLVADALRISGYNPESYGLQPSGREIALEKPGIRELCRLVEGSDNHYCRMLEILAMAYKNPDKLWTILAPWRNQIQPIIDHIIIILSKKYT